MTPRKKQILFILTVLACVVLIDQITKAIVVAKIPVDNGYTLAGEPKFFQFTHQRNPALVGGMFHDKPIMVVIAPIVACGVLLYLYRFLAVDSWLQSLAYGMIAGGAIGNNLIDRVRYGSVTDFLQFYFYFIPFDFPWKYYPAFNVADICICTGVFLLVVTWYCVGDKKEVSDTAAS